MATPNVSAPQSDKNCKPHASTTINNSSDDFTPEGRGLANTTLAPIALNRVALTALMALVDKIHSGYLEGAGEPLYSAALSCNPYFREHVASLSDPGNNNEFTLGQLYSAMIDACREVFAQYPEQAAAGETASMEEDTDGPLPKAAEMQRLCTETLRVVEDDDFGDDISEISHRLEESVGFQSIADRFRTMWHLAQEGTPANEEQRLERRYLENCAIARLMLWGAAGARGLSQGAVR